MFKIQIKRMATIRDYMIKQKRSIANGKYTSRSKMTGMT